MNLKDIIENKKPGILKKWLDTALMSYPEEGRQFLKNRKDPLGNPVGARIKEGLNGILDAIVEKPGTGEIPAFLDDIMRVRAVQSFSPSQAVAFLFELKDILRKELKKDVKRLEEAPAWRTLDKKIDEIALMGFDIFHSCREKVNEIRVNEVRHLSYEAMKRANLVGELLPLTEDEILEKN